MDDIVSSLEKYYKAAFDKGSSRMFLSALSDYLSYIISNENISNIIKSIELENNEKYLELEQIEQKIINILFDEYQRVRSILDKEEGLPAFYGEITTELESKIIYIKNFFPKKGYSIAKYLANNSNLEDSILKDLYPNSKIVILYDTRVDEIYNLFLNLYENDLASRVLVLEKLYNHDCGQPRGPKIDQKISKLDELKKKILRENEFCASYSYDELQFLNSCFQGTLNMGEEPYDLMVKNQIVEKLQKRLKYKRFDLEKYRILLRRLHNHILTQLKNKIGISSEKLVLDRKKNVVYIENNPEDKLNLCRGNDFSMAGEALLVFAGVLNNPWEKHVDIKSKKDNLVGRLVFNLKISEKDAKKYLVPTSGNIRWEIKDIIIVE